MGGTGKTPLLIRLVNDLVQQGVHPAILSRGYGEDEILLMRKKCPHVPVGVGSNRVAKARELTAMCSVDIFLLDDGFQHWQLRRNLDIVCIDATAPFEKESLLPAGRLREPLHGLSRAGVAVLTRTNLVSPEHLTALRKQVQSFMPKGLIISSLFQTHLKKAGTTEPIPWSFLRGKRVVALSAIGNPEAFEKDLTAEGASVIPFRFRDHYEYQEKDIVRIRQMAEKHQALVITTEKDWVKLAKWSLDVFVVEQTVIFSNEDERHWVEAIKKVFA